MRVVELFCSRQGEGLWTGTPSVFVRFGGCPLRCRFCDTPYAATRGEPGEDLSVDEIVHRVMTFETLHVVLTGGEPMLNSALVLLTTQLSQEGKKITVETAGIFDLPVVCDLMSISPKRSNSTPRNVEQGVMERHEKRRHRPDVVRALMTRYPYQFKFVVDTPDDFCDLELFLAELPRYDPSRVGIMPMATDVTTMREKEVWILPWCAERGFFYSPRMQIEWYGHRRGC